MKWVRCVNNGNYSDVTVGKVYEVINFVEEISITGKSRKRIGIINNFGALDSWLMLDNRNRVWFEDINSRD